MSNKPEMGSAWVPGLLLIVFGVLMLMLAATLPVYPDTPTLHRRTEPPVPTLSCTDQLHGLRRQMVNVSIAEALFWEGHHNRQASDFYLIRSHEAGRTHDLDVTAVNCSWRNLQTLNLVLAKWQYDYATDLEASTSAK